jgi:hypothetical protein
MSKCKTKCETAKVCNEATGKCVLRTGKIGQQILGTAAPRAAAPAPRAAAPAAARGQCPPCEAAKVCNAATGRCVLRTGKIGQAILGTAAPRAAAPRAAAPRAAATRATPPRAAPKVRPLTIEEVRRNWPAGVSKLVQRQGGVPEDVAEEWRTYGVPWYKQGLPKFFGPGAQYLDDKLIEELLPNPGDTVRLVLTYEESWGERLNFNSILKPSNAFTATLHRIASAAELWKYRTTDSDSARDMFEDGKMPTEEFARQVVIATAPNNTTFNTTEIFKLDSRGTSSLGYWATGDTSFITWIERPRGANVTMNWSRPGLPASVANASNRGTHKVPTGRGAPAGHAKNFANKTARGLDGGLWKSSQVRSPKGYTWRWKKVQ